MKFVCDRCQTRYSIADEKVRGKILKVRCKSCQNVITVRDAGVAVTEAFDSQANDDRTVMGPPPVAAESFARDESRRSSAAMAAVSARAPVPPPAPPPARDDVQWYMALDGNRTGPYTRKGLIDKVSLLPNGSDVHVWNEHLDGWKAPEQVPAIAGELQARRRPVLPPMPGAGLHSGHSGLHAVPATARARTTTGSQSAVLAPASPRRTAHALPAPTSAQSAASGLSEMPKAAAASPVAEAPAGRGRKPANGVAGNGAGEHGASTAEPAAARTLEPSVAGLNGEAAWTDVKAPPAVEIPTETPAAIGTDVVHPAPAWQPSSVPAVTTRPRSRSVKWILTSLGLVAAVIVLLMYSLIGKKAPPSTMVGAPKTAAPPDNSFSQLADKLAQQAKEPAPPPIEPPPPTVEPPKETTAVVARALKNGKFKGKGKRARELARASQLPTSPPPLATGVRAATTPPESSPSPAAFAGSERRVQLGGGGGAKSTPAQGDITRVINNNKAAIKVCYQRALLKDSSLTHGKIGVRVTLGLSGKVKNVGVDGPPAFLTLQPCIKDMVSRWVFPPSSEQYDTEFSYVFQGNE